MHTACRYESLTYSRAASTVGSVLHGFAGYFETVLYKDVVLSTHPPTHTPGMASWFPIFFPLREPVYVPAGADVTVNMSRCVNPHKVWYEWSVSSPAPTPIHNISGRSYFVGL